MRTPILLAITILIFSCKKKDDSYLKKFNSDSIATQEFSINIHRDTAIYTTGGIKVFVAAYSIAADGDMVTLEIKEVFDIYQMVKSGLYTQAGDDLLSSGGMFFIGTKEKSKIVKPLQVDVPKISGDDVNMKLYRGEPSGKRIDWKSPEEMRTVKDSSLNIGEQIFKSTCANCHSIDRKLVGPPIGGLENIRSKEWLYAFTNYNQDLRESGDPLACCIWKLYGKTDMPSYHFSEKELDALYLYIRNEMRKRGYADEYKPYTTCDSCDYFAKKLNKLQEERRAAVFQNGNQTIVTRSNNTIIQNVAPTSSNGVPHKIDIATRNAEYYQLDIKAYGWYNIDCWMKGRAEAKESYLAVKVSVPVKITASVMLIVPSVKLFAQGGRLVDGVNYGFDERNGKLLLPQNVNAIVMGYTEEKGKIYFALQQFTTSNSQTIPLNLTEKSEAEIMKIIQSLSIQDITMNVMQTKNAELIKSLDERISQLQEKTELCDCVTDFSEVKVDSSK